MLEAHSVSLVLLETDSRRWQKLASIFVTLKTWQGRHPRLPHTVGKTWYKGFAKVQQDVGRISVMHRGWIYKEAGPALGKKRGWQSLGVQLLWD